MQRLDLAADALGDPRCAVDVAGRQQHDELLAAVARDEVARAPAPASPIAPTTARRQASPAGWPKRSL